MKEKIYNLSDKLLLISGAKNIAACQECTKVLVQLYKSNKKYWNKKCEKLYQSLIIYDDVSTVSSRTALHLIILAENRGDISQHLIDNIFGVYFKKILKDVMADKLGSNPDYIGSCMLTYHYYKYLTKTQTKEDIEYVSKFSDIFMPCETEEMIDIGLLNKKKGILMQQDINNFEKTILLIKYLGESLGYALDESIMTMQTTPIITKSAKLLSKNKTEENILTDTAVVLYNLIVLLRYYREEYLKLAVRPEINHNLDMLKEQKDKSSEKEMIIKQQKEQILRLENKLSNSGTECTRRLKDQEKMYNTTIAGLNKTIKQLQTKKR